MLLYLISLTNMLNQNIDNNTNDIPIKEEEKKVNLDNFSYYISHYSIDKTYKDFSEQEIESEVLNLVLIQADKVQGPDSSSPASYRGVKIQIVPPDRSLNIFFKEDVKHLLEELQYNISNSKSQNHAETLKELIEFNNEN
jgi:hypothetical protein